MSGIYKYVQTQECVADLMIWNLWCSFVKFETFSLGATWHFQFYDIIAVAHCTMDISRTM